MRWHSLCFPTILSLILSCLIVPVSGREEEQLPLWQIVSTLKQQYRFVDLTHTFSTETPRWEGFPPMERKLLYSYAKDGFFAELFTHVGQYGTHVDPPVHFHQGLRSVDEIPVEQFLLPLCVIDVREKVAQSPDDELTLEDIQSWEQKYGPIPTDSFVINQSGWTARWPDPKRFLNQDEQGVKHTPGWKVEALRFLFEERRVTAIGHETADTDAGYTKSFDTESYVLKMNRYQIELLNIQEGLPTKGGLVFIGVPKPLKGSGFPARVIAIVPKK